MDTKTRLKTFNTEISPRKVEKNKRTNKWKRETNGGISGRLLRTTMIRDSSLGAMVVND